LRAYIRQIDQNGLLDEAPPNSQPNSPESIQTERWLETVGPPSTRASRTELVPPSFDSLHIHEEDTGAKVRVVSEDNMKFPQSIKSQRAKTGHDGKQAYVFHLTLWTWLTLFSNVPQKDEALEHDYIDVPSSPSPRSVTSTDTPLALQLAVSPAALISTTDLIRYGDNRASSGWRPGSSYDGSDNVYSPSSSPIESRGLAIPADDRVPRSMAAGPRTSLAPETQHYGSSPSQYGTSPRSQSSMYGTSPRNSGLAPDSQGREIPLDAKWTRIRRSLISPEVLKQDKRRYEA
jgi:hypothetical protein